MSDDHEGPREVLSRVSIKRDPQGRVERKLSRAIEDKHDDVVVLVEDSVSEFQLLERRLKEGMITDA